MGHLNVYFMHARTKTVYTIISVYTDIGRLQFNLNLSYFSVVERLILNQSHDCINYTYT